MRFRIVCLAILAAVGPASAGLRCPAGSFVVHGGTGLLAGGPRHDVVSMVGKGRRLLVALGVVCPPVQARARGRRVVARWPPGRCAIAGRVTLKLALDADCQIARGRVRRAGARPVPLDAARCAADGIVSAGTGEECADSAGCPPDRRCVDCRCVPPVDFARDVAPTFQGCLTVACHEGPTAVGSVDLAPGRAYPELLGRSARAGACGGRPLVVPGDSDASVLWKRVAGPECGGRMPLGSALLPAAELDAIRTWIAEGAPES